MAEKFVELQNDDRIRRIIRELEDSVSSRKMMLEIGSFIRFRIQARTAEGKDVSGKNFKPYSPKYKLFREKEGHPTSKVNLFFFGSMMASMAVAETDSTARVYFLNIQGPGGGARNPEKAFYLNEKREFFALNRSDVKGIRDIMERYYQEKLRSIT